MKLKLLREFFILAECLNFTKAAKKLHITQPVLSRHIKELELFFGTELLCRDTHNVALSSAGVLLLHETQKILTQYDQSVTTMRIFTGQSREQLSIVYLGEAVQSMLGNIIYKFNQEHHSIMTHYRDCELDEALELLKFGGADLGFLIRPNLIDQFDGFASLPFKTDPLCAAVNKQHYLANHKKVSLKEIIKWPLIRVDPKEFPLSAEYSTDFIHRYNLDYTLYKEYPNLKTCCFNLEFNHEVVLLMPKHRSYLLGNNSVLLELAEQDCLFNMELVWGNQNKNPSLHKFIGEFKRLLTEFNNSRLEFAH